MIISNWQSLKESASLGKLTTKILAVQVNMKGDDGGEGGSQYRKLKEKSEILKKKT